MNKEELKKELIRFLAFEHTELNTYKKKRLTFEGIVLEYMSKYYPSTIKEPEESNIKKLKEEREIYIEKEDRYNWEIVNDEIKKLEGKISIADIDIKHDKGIQEKSCMHDEDDIFLDDEGFYQCKCGQFPNENKL